METYRISLDRVRSIRQEAIEFCTFSRCVTVSVLVPDHPVELGCLSEAFAILLGKGQRVGASWTSVTITDTVLPTMR